MSGFSGYFPVSSTNETDHHDISEILLKVVLNTINHNQLFMYGISMVMVSILASSAVDHDIG
jgi:hypothetical protein